MGLLKLFLLIPICIVGYVCGSIAAAVEQSELFFYIGFLFGAVVSFFTFAVMFDSDAQQNNSPSLARRLAPLAFFYWLLNRKN